MHRNIGTPCRTVLLCIDFMYTHRVFRPSLPQTSFVALQLNILLAGRVAERLIVVFFGGLSVYWGWRLFLAGINSEADALFARGS